MKIYRNCDMGEAAEALRVGSSGLKVFGGSEDTTAPSGVACSFWFLDPVFLPASHAVLVAEVEDCDHHLMSWGCSDEMRGGYSVFTCPEAVLAVPVRIIEVLVLDTLRHHLDSSGVDEYSAARLHCTVDDIEMVLMGAREVVFCGEDYRSLADISTRVETV